MVDKFAASVLKELKYYVYFYSDPETEEVFYVGKGKGNRVFSHLQDTNESKKVEYIKNLQRRRLKPNIDILVHGIENEDTALRIEASVIDLLGLNNLTNKQGGYKSATYGRMSVNQIKALYDKKPVDIKEPSILIRVSRAFRYTMSEMELYDFTRGQWKLNPEKARRAQYAFSIYEGIIQEVYEILDWYEAGKTFSVRQTEKYSEEMKKETEGRYEFIGNVAPEEIRSRYKHKSVAHYFNKGNSNPIMYRNLD